MKKPIIKLLDKIILLLLGFSGILYSCYKYGMPVDEFELSGTITDQTRTPINNIRIIKQRGFSESGDTLYTNPHGQYAYNFWGERYVHLKVEDIDGEANGGEFLPVEFDVQFTDADLVKKGRRSKKPDLYSKTLNITLFRNEMIPAYGVPVAPFEP
jgi:putative lipoprotein (rSAM/lipoprotein system)